MDIIVHNHFTLTNSVGSHPHLYSTPIWEIELQSLTLDSSEFESELYNDDNFVVSKGHRDNLRSMYNGSGLVSAFLNESKQDFLLDLVSQSPCFKTRFFKPIDEYRHDTSWFSSVLKDQPKFKMGPHLDNSHVMIQMVVNLMKDNETATEFYYTNEHEPCYQAPLKKNHGIVFLNTPGAVHSIVNPNNTRWIFYGGVLF